VQGNLPVNVLSATFPGHGHGQAFNSPDDLPKTVLRTLNQGSSPMSMDFHPVQQTLLLGQLLLQSLSTVFFDLFQLHLFTIFAVNWPIFSLDGMFQLVQMWRTLVYGNWALGSGWSWGTSKFGIWVLVQCHFRLSFLVYTHWCSWWTIVPTPEPCSSALTENKK